MPKSISKSPQAYRDLIDIAIYIAQDSADASERFLEAAESTFEVLATTPELGSLCPFKNPLAAGIRVYPVRRFRKHLIFYRVESVGIYVIRVMHGARDWQGIFEKLEND
jgi:toxin ParE1/3/4